MFERIRNALFTLTPVPDLTPEQEIASLKEMVTARTEEVRGLRKTQDENEEQLKVFYRKLMEEREHHAGEIRSLNHQIAALGARQTGYDDVIAAQNQLTAWLRGNLPEVFERRYDSIFLLVADLLGKANAKLDSGWWK